MHITVLDSASTLDAPTVIRRGGLIYSLDLQAPAELRVQPHVEVVHGTDVLARSWELGELSEPVAKVLAASRRPRRR